MGEKVKILIVEDDPELRDAMTELLSASGYEVASAASGAEGLAKVCEFGPDLILLDVMMEANTTGFHLAYKLRDAKEDSLYAGFRNVPILMITGIREKTNFRFSLQSDGDSLPADLFLTRPAQPAQLLQAVEDVLNNMQDEG